MPRSSDRTGDVLLATGAGGMLGSRALARLLRADRTLRAIVLVRDPGRWRSLASARFGSAAERVRPVAGDVRKPGLGLSSEDRAAATGSTTTILHAAADIVFSRTLEEARDTNVIGTEHVLDVADACPLLRRFTYVSTAFVAGRSRGRIPEAPLHDVPGWVNPYERSKHEAEAVVRAARPEATIVRSSTVVFDRAEARIPQFNAAHKALRLLHGGLVPMMPGAEDTPVDLVPADFVADGIARLTLSESARGRTFHLCAGDGALALGDLLASCWAEFGRDAGWRIKAIPPPALVDIDTYRLFERTVEQTADAGLRRASRGLSHFIPHLAYPKRFVTTAATAELGRCAPSVADYWPDLLRHLIRLDWTFPAAGAAA